MRVLLLRGALLFLLLGIARPSHGQTLWTRPYQPNQIALEWVVPTFEDEPVETLTSAAFLTATRSLTDNVELVGELPVAYYAADAGGGTITTSAVGNPYLGVGLSSTTTPFLFELGVRLPAAPDNEASFAGTIANAGRGTAFRHDAVTVSALLNWRFAFSRRTSLRIQTGGAFSSYPDSSDATVSDVRLRYGVQLWRMGNPILLGLTSTGRISFEQGDAFAANTRHSLAGSVMLDSDAVQPGLLVGIALDGDVRDVASFFVGVTLSMSYAE